jgi:hypothetical protein
MQGCGTHSITLEPHISRTGQMEYLLPTMGLLTATTLKLTVESVAGALSISLYIYYFEALFTCLQEWSMGRHTMRYANTVCLRIWPGAQGNLLCGYVIQIFSPIL